MDYIQIMFQSYPDVVTVSQLKEMLSIGYNQAYALVRSGAIPSIKIGKEYRIVKSSIIDFVLNTK